MGNDTPLACLTMKPQMVFDYFKQLFAQVIYFLFLWSSTYKIYAVKHVILSSFVNLCLSVRPYCILQYFILLFQNFCFCKFANDLTSCASLLKLVPMSSQVVSSIPDRDLKESNSTNVLRSPICSKLGRLLVYHRWYLTHYILFERRCIV